MDPEHGREEQVYYQKYEATASDDVGNAIGLPWGSVLVLRNLARNIPKAAGVINPDNRAEISRTTIETLFGPLKDRLLFVMAYNKPLAGYVLEVLAYVEKGSAIS